MVLLTDRMRRLFGHDHLFWRLMAWVGGSIAVGKGLRLPNRWSATQAQVDYHLGFVKRGLFGQSIGVPLGLQHYKRFALVSCAILALFLASLVAFTVTSKVSERLDGLRLPALFFSSYGLTYLVNLSGYFDLLLALLAIAVLQIGSPWLRICVAVPVSIVALLIHELFLFAFVPVLLLSFLLQAEGLAAEAPRPRRRVILMMVFLLAVVSIVTVVWTSLRPSLAPERAALLQRRIESRADFPLRKDFFAVMTRSAKDNVIETRRQYYRSQWWIENAISLIVFAPTVIVLLLITRRLVQEDGRARGWTAALASLSALSPLVLHLLGWDAARWNALVVLTAYLVLLTVCRFARAPRIDLSLAWKNAIALVVVLNIASGSLLINLTSENVFPFIHSFPFRDLAAHGITPPPN